MSNNPVDSIVLGGIDQFLPQRQTEKEFLNAVDHAVREAIDKKDVASLGKIGTSCTKSSCVCNASRNPIKPARVRPVFSTNGLAGGNAAFTSPQWGMNSLVVGM